MRSLGFENGILSTRCLPCIFASKRCARGVYLDYEEKNNQN